MRRCLALLGVLLVALVCAAGEAKDPLAPGGDLPGTFHPFNVNEAFPPIDAADEKEKPVSKHKIEAHSTKGKFHSLISEYDLEPVVMLFAKGSLDENPALGKLLQSLDGAIERNRKGARLHAFVVFLYDDLTDVLDQDDLREQHARKLEKLAEDLKLRNVVVALAAKPDVAKYRLGDGDALTAVLYRKFRIASVHKSSADKLDDAAKAILADVAGKLGATRQPVLADMEESLLQAIHDNPADEPSWLVLADWLEEQGDPRAELVRLQQLRGDLPERRREQAEVRARALLERGVTPCVPALINSIGMRLVLIRAGSFWMGSPVEEEDRYADEDPRHRVEITRPFYLGAYQVTQAAFSKVLRRKPGYFRAGGNGSKRVGGLDTGQFPVESVSWEDAEAFCTRLSELPEEKKAGRMYRLPSEAEWEYACRAGTASSAPFHFGHSFSSRQGNFDGTRPYGGAKRGPNLKRPCTVGSYVPNAFGLYDMHGNVWEWCQDWFDPDYYSISPERDPQGPQDGETRVLRGGSFYYIGSSCRAAIRFGRGPEARSNLDGFRVAMTTRRT